MKKNILISVCIATCGIAMLGFIKIIKAKEEAKTEYKYLKTDTTVKVNTLIKQVNIVETNKRVANGK